MSTFTFWNSCGRNAFMASAVWMVASNNFSSRSAPTRFRHLLKLDGSIGNSCCMYVAAAEELPVRVLHPAGHHRFVALIESVLQVQRGRPSAACSRLAGRSLRHNKRRWPRRTATNRSARPARTAGARVQQFAQLSAKQFTLRSGCFRFHFFASFWDPRDKTWRILAR